MAMLRAWRAWTRRQFLVRSTSAVGSLAMPGISRAADRPGIAGGIQSGDVSDGSAVVWARADRPARMQVECSTVESFKTIIASAARDALPDADCTAKLLLDDLPPGQDVFYRVRFDDIATGIGGERRVGHFRTAPVAGQSISFLWSGDVAGQGWGIDIARGGYRSYRTMLSSRPDFFIHSGDHIYADCTIPSEQKLPRPITTIRTRRSSAISSRSGSSSPGPCMQAPGAPASSMTRLALSRCTGTVAARLRARTSPPVSACSSSAASTSMAPAA